MIPLGPPHQPSLPPPLAREFNDPLSDAVEHYRSRVFEAYFDIVESHFDLTALNLATKLLPVMQTQDNRTTDFIMPHKVTGDDDSLGPVETNTHQVLRAKFLDFVQRNFGEELKNTKTEPNKVAVALEVYAWNTIRERKKIGFNAKPEDWVEWVSLAGLRYKVLRLNVFNEEIEAKRQKGIEARRLKNPDGFVVTGFKPELAAVAKQPPGDTSEPQEAPQSGPR